MEASKLVKAEIRIPPELHEKDAELNDDVLQQQKQRKYQELQASSGVLSLIEDPANHVLIVLGTKESVARAKSFAPMHFKHRIEMVKLRRKTLSTKQFLEVRVFCI